MAEQPAPTTRMRRYPLSDAVTASGGGAADIERVFDTYGIRNFEYRTWGRWSGGLPDGARIHGGAAEDTMNDRSRRASPGAGSARVGAYEWSMPEDLKMGALPLLSRMPDTASLVARLKLEGGPVVSMVEDAPTLPELRDTAEEVEEEVAAAAPQPSPRATASIPTVAATKAAPKAPTESSNDARSRLRRLALKGQTHG